MRRWIALIAGVLAVAVAGTALALTGSGSAEVTEKPASEDSERYETPTLIEIRVDEKPEPPVEEPKEAPAPTEKEVEAPGEPNDTTPPDLAILHPAEGQAFEEKEVVFEGITEPGARVFAGKYEADVRDDGTWRIVLYLSPGGNLATIRAKDGAGNVSSASVFVTYQAPQQTAEKPEETPEDKPKEGEGAVWEFSAHQVYGECSETPPFDVFHGTGAPGTAIHVKSEYGGGIAEVNDDGLWEVRVYFETAPIGAAFPVKVKDELGHYQVFEFTHTD
jgi:hypothetical protein